MECVDSAHQLSIQALFMCEESYLEHYLVISQTTQITIRVCHVCVCVVNKSSKYTKVVQSKVDRTLR